MGARPWLGRPLAGAARAAAFGEVLPEIEHLGLLALADEFDAIALERIAADVAASALLRHPAAAFLPLERLAKRIGDSKAELARGGLPLTLASGERAGAVRAAHPDDPSLAAGVLLENLACKATG